jgi:small subunit ribosomal protein S17
MTHTLIGDVVSDKGDKTIVVAIHTRKTHPIYKKQYSVTKRIMAHDEKNEAKIGDKVLIAECRPISAKKRWMFMKITETARIKHIEPSVDEEPKETEEVKK